MKAIRNKGGGRVGKADLHEMARVLQEREAVTGDEIAGIVATVEKAQEKAPARS
jgi:hypothetical protein